MSTSPAVELDGVTHRYGATTALHDVSLTLRPGVVTGLVGRNGAGKSTLCRLVAALAPVQQGAVRVGGAPVWENGDVTAQVCLVREGGTLLESLSTRDLISVHRRLRPNWEQAVYDRVVDRFEVPARRSPARLSTGQRAAVRIALALASRAEVTVLDEVHLGLDAVARRWYYEELLADYTEHPRTIVLSSHLLDEIEPLVEDVVVLDRGRIVAAGEVDDVRAAHATGERLPSLTDVLVSLTTKEVAS